MTLVELEPTPDALRRAKDLPPGVESALGREAVVCNVLGTGGSATYRWLLVENSALLVRTNSVPTARDRAFLELLEALLREAADG